MQTLHSALLYLPARLTWYIDIETQNISNQPFKIDQKFSVSFIFFFPQLSKLISGQHQKEGRQKNKLHNMHLTVLSLY